MRLFKPLLSAMLALFGVAGAEAAALQTPVDQANPAIVEQETRRPDQPDGHSLRTPTIDTAKDTRVDLGEPVFVSAIHIEGVREIPVAAFAQTIDRWSGKNLSPQDLQTLASEVASIARARGYGLATAWIPSQTLSNNVLRVVLDEGRIDALRVTGDAADAVRRRLAPLANGRAITTTILERRLLLAADIEGVGVGKARLERSNGCNVLVVTTSRDRLRLHAYLDNWGSSVVGPARARLSVELNGLLASDDQLTVGGMVTPLQPREFQFVQANYSKPIATGATELHVDGYYAHTRAGGSLRDYDFTGDSSYVEIGSSTAVVRRRSGSLWLNLGFGHLDSKQAEAGDRFRHDRETIAYASLYGTTGNDRDRIRARLTLSQGLNLFDATRRDDPLRSRRDADAVFSKVETWAAYDRKLTPQLSAQIQVQAQWASGPLLSSDEMGLGGRYFLRGYDYREYGGDVGAAGSAELRYDMKQAPLGLNAFQIYGYADAGRVRNLRQGFGSGSLASAGAGIRARLKSNVDLGLELGVPLVHGAIKEQHYHPRVSFTLGAHF